MAAGRLLAALLNERVGLQYQLEIELNRLGQGRACRDPRTEPAAAPTPRKTAQCILVEPEFGEQGAGYDRVADHDGIDRNAVLVESGRQIVRRFRETFAEIARSETDPMGQPLLVHLRPAQRQRDLRPGCELLVQFGQQRRQALMREPGVAGK